MKKYITLMAFLLTHSAFAQMMQPQGCLSDVACFYEEVHRKATEEKMKERQELQEYREQQLLLEEVRINEMQKQTELLEEQNELSQEQLESLKEKDKPKDQQPDVPGAAGEPTPTPTPKKSTPEIQ